MKNILTGQEKTQLTKQANQNVEFKLLLQLISQEKQLKLNNKSIETSEINKGHYSIEMLKMNLDQNFDLYFVKSDRGNHSFVKNIYQKDTNVFIEAYEIENGELTKVYNQQYAKEQYDEIQKNSADNVSIANQSQDGKVTISAVPCLYGNWCGPGCSGPEAPISEVDTCCMEHDNCYAEEGYFDCGCDEDILQCLAPYYYQGSEWAILITNYFLEQYDINC
ncbi:hypothetical protein [Salibacterium sp. K-3]